MTDKLTRFTIRQSLRDVQERRRFSTLEELARAVEEDLQSEGYALGPAAKDKIRQLVEDEGYTGSFAIDDALRRKLKKTKLWPAVSLILALAAFLLTTVSSALIEHFIQGPLDKGSADRQITASFSVPARVDQDVLRYSIRIRNTAGKPLRELVVFASAEQAVQQLAVDVLAPGEDKLLEGSLDLTGVRADEFAFTAYIIGSGFSFRSEPLTVSRASGTQVAVLGSAAAPAPSQEMAFAPPREEEGAGAESLERSSDKAVPSAPQPERDEETVALDTRARQSVALERRPSTARGKSTGDQGALKKAALEEPGTHAMRAMDSENEVELLIRKARSGAATALEKQLLEAYARSGNQKAAGYRPAGS